MIVFFGALALTLIVGIPISIGLAMACVAFMWWTGTMSLMLAFPQKMLAGIDQFVLLAIPLFVLAGSLMSRSGITDKIVVFARSLVGHVPGGLSLANVLGCMLFGGISGSATAEAAAMGSVMIPAMEKEGYPRPYAAGLTAVASLMGPLVPPSLALILYGVLSGTSISDLFIAGIGPALLICAALMIYAYWRAKRDGYPISERSTWPMRGNAILRAGPALLLPVIIIGGIRGGVFTPTESAAVGVAYALFLAVFFYRSIDFATAFEAFRDTAISTAGILYVIAVASMVAFVFTFEGVPQQVAQFMLSITDNKYLLLLLINILLLGLGMFLETLSIMIMTLPILIGVVKALGIDMVHFGMIMVLNLVIGLVTPPVGICLFITSAISGVPIDKLTRAAMPMLLIAIGVLMIVTYVPAVSLFLPSLLNGD